MTAYDIIIRPVITERSMAAVAEKKYVFEVAKTAGKIEIKKAVEEIFGVKVASVNTLNVPGKAKRLGAGRPGMTRSWKKAYVQLTADSKAVVVTPVVDEIIVKSARNIPGVLTTPATNLNVYDLVNAQYLVVDQAALATIEEVYA